MELKNRKNPRLKEFDYASPNYYFITICTHDKKKLFGEAGKQNTLGKIADEAVSQISKHFTNVTVDKYVIMPNHVHMIVILHGDTSNLSSIIGSYKSFVTKEIHSKGSTQKIWQVSFHDHVIRNRESYLKIWNYIDTNPIKWSEDCYFEE